MFLISYISGFCFNPGHPLIAAICEQMEQIQKLKVEYLKIKSKLQVNYKRFENVSQEVKESALRFIITSDFNETLETKPLSLEEFKVTSFNVRLQGKESSQVHYEVRKLLDKISIPLSKRFGGHFIPDGSSADGTKVIRPDEFDYLYEIGIYNPVELTQISDDLTCNVTHNGTTLSAPEIFQQFAEEVCSIVRELSGSELDNVGHGGFSNPRFSGIRINAPAVTLLFTYKSIDTLTHLLSLDLAVGIRIPDHELNKVLGEQNRVNRALLKCIERDNPLLAVTNSLHLVAANTAAVISWNVTTSCFESDVFRGLPPECPLKQAIRITKILRHDVLDRIWSYQLDGKSLGSPFRDLTAVEEVSRLIDVTPDGNMLKTISESMAYCHIMQSYEDAEKRCEIPTREVTLNSFAIKQLAFKVACDIPGAFGPESSDAIVHELLLAIWKSLSEEKLFQIPHSFISYRVRLLSISCIAADHWLHLNLIIKEQCKQIYRKFSGQLLEPFHGEKLLTLPDSTELNSVFKGTTSQEQIQLIHELEIALVDMLDLLVILEPHNRQWKAEKAHFQPVIHQQKPDFCLSGYNDVIVRASTRKTMPSSVVLAMDPVEKHLAPLYDKVKHKMPLMQKMREHLKYFRQKEVTHLCSHILLSKNNVLRLSSLEVY